MHFVLAKMQQLQQTG